MVEFIDILFIAIFTTMVIICFNYILWRKVSLNIKNLMVLQNKVLKLMENTTSQKEIVKPIENEVLISKKEEELPEIRIEEQHKINEDESTTIELDITNTESDSKQNEKPKNGIQIFYANESVNNKFVIDDLKEKSGYDSFYKIKVHGNNLNYEINTETDIKTKILTDINLISQDCILKNNRGRENKNFTSKPGKLSKEKDGYKINAKIEVTFTQ